MEARWQLFEPAEGAPRPAKRDGHSAVVDAASRRLLVFGGDAGSGDFLNDVWAFGLEAKSWEELGTAGPRPEARYAHSAILDPTARAMVIFGGGNGGFRRDAWAFGLEDQGWRELRPKGELPAERRLHSAIFDPKGQQMVVFGGLGGTGEDFSALDDVFILELQAERWAELRPEGRRPAPRYLHSASYEEAAHAMLLFGGTEDGDNFFSDLWSLDLEAKRWEEIQAAEGPPAVCGHTSACAAGQLLVFGGDGEGGRLGDLWMFDLEARRWELLPPVAASPGAREWHAAAFDSASGSWLLFGGEGEGRLDDLWALDLFEVPWQQLLEDLFQRWQEAGLEPLPVVRLCLVGRGRAGKTTTLRRLKGEEVLPNEEASTAGVEVWTREVQKDVAADSSDCTWQMAESSVLEGTAAAGLRTQAEERAAEWRIRQEEERSQKLQRLRLAHQQAKEKKDDSERQKEQEKMEEGWKEAEKEAEEERKMKHQNEAEVKEKEAAAREPQESLGVTVGPAPLGQDLTLQLSGRRKADGGGGGAGDSENPGPQLRLQAWDFPGQREYAQLNLLYFTSQAIYLVMTDLSGDLEEEWAHLKYWLWAIAQVAKQAENEGKETLPPVFLVGTKWDSRKDGVDKWLQKRLEAFFQQVPAMRELMQEGPGVCNEEACCCEWLFPVENKAKPPPPPGPPPPSRPPASHPPSTPPPPPPPAAPPRVAQPRLGHLGCKGIDKLREAVTAAASESFLPRSSAKGKAVKPHWGMNSDRYPVAWLRGYELLNKLGEGFPGTVSQRELLQCLEKTQTEQSSENPPLCPKCLGPAVVAKTKSFLEVKGLDGQDLRAPPGADLRATCRTCEGVRVTLSYDFIKLADVKALLQGMQPKGLDQGEVERLLERLNALGTLIWFKEAGLKEEVMLAPRKVALALTSLMLVRFRHDGQWHHSEDYIKKIDERVQKAKHGDVLRFRTSGVATQDFLDTLWHTDFEPPQQKLLHEFLLRRGLMNQGAEKHLFSIPSCLPRAQLPEAPVRKADEVIYVNLDGFVSPNLFPDLAAMLYKQMSLSMEHKEAEDEPKGELTVKPGPPQVFSNRVEVRVTAGGVPMTVALSLFPLNSQKLLRIHARSHGRSQRDPSSEAGKAAQAALKAFHAATGFNLAGYKALQASDSGSEGKDGLALDWQVSSSCNLEDRDLSSVEELARNRPCLEEKCGQDLLAQRCTTCRLAGLLAERFEADLGERLQKVIPKVSIWDSTRPAGSFRFQVVRFPGDVDLSEYLIFQATDEQDALRQLADLLQTKFSSSWTDQADQGLHWAGLKTGDPKSDKKSDLLKWSLSDIKSGHKGEISLQEALACTSRGRTAKIDIFAKTDMFQNETAEQRFVEVTNVLYVGYFSAPGDGIIPITRDANVIEYLGEGLRDYSAKHPKPMKYVKRLWERSVFFAQRGWQQEANVAILELLKPMLQGGAAELCQLAAHAETLITMLECETQATRTDALQDLHVLCTKLSHMHTRLDKNQGAEEAEAAKEACLCLEEIRSLSLETETKEAQAREQLEMAQGILEGTADLLVINALGAFSSPVALPLGREWRFPSDHPPVGATVAVPAEETEETLHVASWNVLNKAYVNHIQANTQGLNESLICDLHSTGVDDAGADARERMIVGMVLSMMCRQVAPVHLLCLQECSQSFLAALRSSLEASGNPHRLALVRGGAEDDKNQEALIYNEAKLTFLSNSAEAYPSDKKKAILEAKFRLKSCHSPIRVVTTHLPGKPFGPARREFCKCLKTMLAKDKQPTLLLADLNFPEEAVASLLHLHGVRASFVEIPYPTNICTGSLLPKRIDSIGIIPGGSKITAGVFRARQDPAGAKPPKPCELAEELLEGCGAAVELLESRHEKLDVKTLAAMPVKGQRVRRTFDDKEEDAQADNLEQRADPEFANSAAHLRGVETPRGRRSHGTGQEGFGPEIRLVKRPSRTVPDPTARLLSAGAARDPQVVPSTPRPPSPRLPRRPQEVAGPALPALGQPARPGGAEGTVHQQDNHHRRALHRLPVLQM